jgi:hypothetical protein
VRALLRLRLSLGQGGPGGDRDADASGDGQTSDRTGRTEAREGVSRDLLEAVDDRLRRAVERCGALARRAVRLVAELVEPFPGLVGPPLDVPADVVAESLGLLLLRVRQVAEALLDALRLPLDGPSFLLHAVAEGVLIRRLHEVVEAVLHVL